MELRGHSMIGFADPTPGGKDFSAVNPGTNEMLPGAFTTATAAQIDHAARLASGAARAFGRLTGRQRGVLLRAIAAAMEAAGEGIVARAQQETALSPDRLRGELGRTTGQLRLFASLCEEGSWVDTRIDSALPDRKPLPRPDIRSMLHAVGPVVVFGASNFPLAFSVAGGDTASALAAGNPVIVKAHPAHPGTSELVARAMVTALREAAAPEGTFSLLFDDAVDVGRALVQHPLVKAVGFTGSRRAGRALMDMAAGRPEPIPVFAEMSSSNPLFILPGSLRERAEQIASGLFASFTLGVGQFCTKPGLVFVENGDEGDRFVARVIELANSSKEGILLTKGIASAYQSGVKARTARIRPLVAGKTEAVCGAAVSVFETDCSTLRDDMELADELFGPTVLIVRCNGSNEMVDFASNMPGQLTGTIHGTNADLLQQASLVEALQSRAGRLIFNGFPTGVEVCHAMVHGGPYPATSDSRFSSVGTMAIRRFARPVCFQSFPDEALPHELQDANPLGIERLVNGQPTRAAVSR